MSCMGIYNKEEKPITVDQLQELLLYVQDFLFIGDEGEKLSNSVTDLQLIVPKAPDDIILEEEDILGETFEGVVYISTATTFSGYKIRGKNFFLNLYE